MNEHVHRSSRAFAVGKEDVRQLVSRRSIATIWQVPQFATRLCAQHPVSFYLLVEVRQDGAHAKLRSVVAGRGHEVGHNLRLRRFFARLRTPKVSRQKQVELSYRKR